MTCARHERLQRIFARACELRADERTRYLDRTCGDDVDLRRQADDLLAHDEHPIRFVDRALVGGGAEVLARELGETGALMPEYIGRYRILRRLAEGGMGVIYEAEQRQPRRRVALKVIQIGLLSATEQRRFHNEAQVLGRLRHPGIAQVLEAGTARTSTGLVPFIAMELVQGEHLLDACAKLPQVAARLKLFADVCDAVQYAHEHGVVHRDLKPENILVENQGGQPKVLDFGVARATGADLPTLTVHTSPGLLIGTLPYMSPEQAAGEANSIDARSDIYSLGVILYELLAGRLPYQVAGRPLHEAVRVIQHEEPTRLGSIARSLGGDLETIAARAMAKDRARRYASAGEMAADLRRHLDHQPILARPASTLYRLHKLVQRRKTAFAVAAGGAVLTAALAFEHPGALRPTDRRAADQAADELVHTSTGVRGMRFADTWRARHPDAVAFAFDQFWPGVQPGGGLLTALGDPEVLTLAGATVTVRCFDVQGDRVPAIRDVTSRSRASDAFLPKPGGKLVLEFDPPVTAFFTMLGSVATGSTVTASAFADGTPVGFAISPASGPGFSTGFGFEVPVPCDRIEFTTTDPKGAVLGAFRFLARGEPSLGSVVIPGYRGPSGDTVQFDFACAFDRPVPTEQR